MPPPHVGRFMVGDARTILRASDSTVGATLAQVFLRRTNSGEALHRLAIHVQYTGAQVMAPRRDRYFADDFVASSENRCLQGSAA